MNLMRREIFQTKPAAGLFAFLWIGYVAVIAHMLYSSLGINLIDDGFTLAYARRLLDGQIPHRDFIIIRPALSPLLHVPEVLWGGPYTFWLSRFVFFLQCACIAWFGTAFVNKSLGRPFRGVTQAAFALVSFMLGCQSFPAMAWHTIDGLFLCVLGVWLRSRLGRRAVLAGYLLLGGAYLCKQGFIFVAPAALLVFGDWRKWRCLVAVALPGLFYVGFLLSCGALADGLRQLLAHTEFLQVGVQRYNNLGFYLGLLGGSAMASLLCSASTGGWPRSRSVRRGAGFVSLAVLLGVAIRTLSQNEIYLWSFRVFGVGCGVVLYLILEGGPRVGERRIGLMALMLAWAASLSFGYNSPVLGTGLLMTFLFALAYLQVGWTTVPWRPVVAIVAVLATLPAFHQTRTHGIYREQDAAKLTCPLGGVLPGARLIYTNPNTHAFLTDLNVAIGMAATNGLRYAIVPEVAAHWVKAAQRNPLPIDWAKTTELSTTGLLDRVIRSLEGQRPEQVVLVQKVTANSLQDGFYPLENRQRRYPAAAYVRKHFEKIGETTYFDLYR